MNFKILQVPYKTKEKQEVLLHRDMDENGELSDVKIKAFIRPDELWHEELIQFENEAAAKRFIKDFSQEAAQEFVERFVI